MELLLYTPKALSVYKCVHNPSPNRFRDEFINKYSKPISKLAPSQQNEIYEMAKLAYKAGVQDTKHKYKIKKTIEYEDDDDD